jgi:chaperonin GroEL (HSP60 family)
MNITALVNASPDSIRERCHMAIGQSRIQTLWMAQSEINIIQPTPTCSGVSTIVICGPSEGLLAEYERAVRRTLKLVNGWLVDESSPFIAGGGAWEARVSAGLPNHPIAARIISRALTAVPRWLIQNASRRTTSLCSVFIELDKLARSKDPSATGIVVIPGLETAELVGSPLLNGIAEPLFLKHEIFSLIVNTVVSLLRIGGIVHVKKRTTKR